MPGQHPVLSLLGLQSSALLDPMHPGGTIPLELPVSPGRDSRSQDALCQALSLAHCCGDYRGPAQDPSTPCCCRAEELALPRALWQEPAISICGTETVAHLPSAHSRDIFRPGCADEGEMTGSLRIQATGCFSQPQLPGAMGGVGPSDKAAHGRGVPGAGATAMPPGKAALPVCCGCGLAGSSCWCWIPPSSSFWTCTASLLLRKQIRESIRSPWLLSLKVFPGL